MKSDLQRVKPSKQWSQLEHLSFKMYISQSTSTMAPAHKIQLNIDDGNLIWSQMELAMWSFNIIKSALETDSNEKSILSKYCRQDFDLVMSWALHTYTQIIINRNSVWSENTIFPRARFYIDQSNYSKWNNCLKWNHGDGFIDVAMWMTVFQFTWLVKIANYCNGILYPIWQLHKSTINWVAFWTSRKLNKQTLIAKFE